eukprot:3652400-Pleurochrysis_carterae.AAC.1
MSYKRLQRRRRKQQWQPKRRAPLTRPTSSRCRPPPTQVQGAFDEADAGGARRIERQGDGLEHTSPSCSACSTGPMLLP